MIILVDGAVSIKHSVSICYKNHLIIIISFSYKISLVLLHLAIKLLLHRKRNKILYELIVQLICNKILGLLHIAQNAIYAANYKMTKSLFYNRVVLICFLSIIRLEILKEVFFLILHNYSLILLSKCSSITIASKFIQARVIWPKIQ